MIATPPEILSYATAFTPRDGPPAFPNLHDGLVGAWYPSLGPTGLTLHDQGPHESHGTLINMDPGTDWVQSPLGWVIDLGGNQWVDCGVLKQFGTVSDVGRTFIVWFRLTTTAWREAFITVGTNNYIGQFQWWNHVIRGPIFTVKDGGGTLRYLWWNPHTVVANRWYCGAVVVKPPTITMYFGGKVVASNSIMVGGFGAASPTCLLGTDNGVTSPFNGRIGPVAVWNRALVSDEIQHLYRDPFAPLRPRRQRRVYAFRVAGPYHPEIGQALVAGPEAGQSFGATATTGQTFNTGQIAGATHG